MLSVDDFCFEVLDVLVIEAKPAFQGTIGHTDLALELCENLGKDVVEGHESLFARRWPRIAGFSSI
jgi:hypothetical protein